MNGLDGKTAIVTGAAGGIGLEIAARLAAEGVRVCIADVVDDVGTTAASLPGEALAFKGDLSDEHVVAELVATTAATFGASTFS